MILIIEMAARENTKAIVSRIEAETTLWV